MIQDKTINWVVNDGTTQRRTSLIVPLFDVDKHQWTVEIETGDEKNEEKAKRNISQTGYSKKSKKQRLRQYTPVINSVYGW